jgi:uncharacterized protein (TIGR03083 family)
VDRRLPSPHLIPDSCVAEVVCTIEAIVRKEETMATSHQLPDRALWDATNVASKDNLLRVVGEEATQFLQLAEAPEHWEAPTASGHWQVRDLVGHMVDVTEGYLDAFNLARSGGPAPAPLGLRIMAQRLDEHAQAFRPIPQAEMLQRLRGDFEQMMAVFEGLGAEDWTGLMPPHPYMGPVPSFVFAVFHLVDYGVHSWDIREGLGLPNGLRGDVADFLVPIMFILWQNTTEFERVGADPVQVGIRVSGRNGGNWRVTVTESGYSYEPGQVDGADLPVVFDFDPGSLVLTAYGRIHGGTAYGDPAIADRYRTLFHAI